MPDRIITGIPGIDRKLAALATNDANKVARSALNAGITDLAKQIKREIDSESISPRLKRALKACVGKRLEISGKLKYGAVAKAGFGVGKNTRAKALRQEKRMAKRGARAAAKGQKAKGVGISSNDVHWFALGTSKRFTKTPRRYVGAVTPVRAVRRTMSSVGTIRGVIERKARERMEEVVRSAGR